MKYNEAVSPFEFGEGSKYVVVIHGYTGTPYEMRGLAQHLASQDFHVIGVRLPGHGQTKEELLKMSNQREEL
ncbi:MAG: alpha/beta hydrolase [Promethearchaeota archaeon]